MRSIIIASIVALAGLAAAGENDPRTIVVYGVAQTLVAPDQVRWQVELAGHDKKLHKAKRRCDEQVDEVLAQLAGLGISQEDLRLGRLSIRPVWTMHDNGKRDLKNYKVARNLIITQRDLSRLEEFFDALMIEHGLEAHMRFEYSGRDAETERLRVEALANARQKAQVLAAVVGAEIGAALEVSEFKPRRVEHDYSHDAVKVRERRHQSGDPNEIQLEMLMFATFELNEPAQVPPGGPD